MRGSIVLVTHNHAAYLRCAVRRLIAHTDPVSCEIIAIDNGSDSETLEFLRDCERTGVTKHVAFNNENIGYAAACNQGIRLASCRWVVFVHSDCFVTPGWLPRLLSHFESSNKDIRIGAVVPMTNYANEGFAVYSQMLHDRFVEYKLPNKASPNESEIEAVVDRTYPSGLDAFAKGIRWRTPLVYSTDISSFCTAFSKEVFDECGMFDEAYTFRGYEDKDMRCRMERHGFEVWSAKNCFVHHFGNITSDGDGFCFPELMRRNRERFERTWMSA